MAWAAMAARPASPERPWSPVRKFWVNAIEIGKDAIFVQIVTDPYDDGRYYGILKFWLPKGCSLLPTMPSRWFPRSCRPSKRRNRPASRLRLPPLLRCPPLRPGRLSGCSAASTGSRPRSDRVPGHDPGASGRRLGEPERKAALGPKQIFIYSELR